MWQIRHCFIDNGRKAILNAKRNNDANMVSPIDFEIKKAQQRRWSYRKGRIGSLLEKSFGASFPSGECELYVEGKLVDAHSFKGVKQRKDIFRFWERRYRTSYRKDIYIHVKYFSCNQKFEKKYPV